MQDIIKRYLAAAACLAAAALAGAAARAAAADREAPATFTVVVPADAEVFFDGEATEQKGTERLFQSPPLAAGKKYAYEVSARWKDGDKPVEKTRRVEFAAGGAVRVDFLAPATGAEVGKPTGAEVGKSVGAEGRLVSREGGPKNPWQIVGDKAPVYADDLLIGIPGNEVESKDGAVHITLKRYFKSPLPTLEPAVTIHAGGDFDLDFTLERGVVEFWNAKPQGSARVRLEARGETWEAVLEEPGSRLLVELYSGWPKGARFTKNPGPKDVPLARMTFLVVKGQVDLKHAGRQVAMGAPPGFALIEWDSVTGMDDSPRKLDELPAWVLPPTDEAGKAFAKAVEDRVRRFSAEALKAHSVDAAIDTFLASDDAGDRKLAVLALAATDQMKRLGQVLKETDKPDVWDDAVLALRHWIGRAPGQDQILFQGTIDAKVFTPQEAATAMDLLHDFNDDDLTNPVTYEMLVNLLGSDKRFIRGLAYWHLSRLVPDGKAFGYDPFGPPEARDAAIKKWKELIPAGKLPPPPKELGK